MAKVVGGIIPGGIRNTYRAEGGALTRGYAVMQGTAADQCKAPTGAAVRVLGVVDEAVAAAGDPAAITIFGPCVAIAGGLIPADGFVKNDANGKFVASAGEDTENAGYALTNAAADGDEFMLFMMPVKKRS